MATNEKRPETMALAVQQLRDAAVLPVEFWPDERIRTLYLTCAPKGASLQEFALLLAVAARYDLDPMVQEIWLGKGGKEDRLQVLTGRAAFVKIANRDPDYRGFTSGVVYEKDEFRLEQHGDDIIVHHVINGLDRGALLGAYCVAYHAKRKPAKAVRLWSQYAHLHHKDNWQRSPEDMIETRPIVAAHRKLYPISGIYVPEEMDEEANDQWIAEQATNAAVAQETRARLEGLRNRLGASLTLAEAVDETVAPRAQQPPATEPVPVETTLEQGSRQALHARYMALWRETMGDETMDEDARDNRTAWQQRVTGKASTRGWTAADYQKAIVQLAALREAPIVLPAAREGQPIRQRVETPPEEQHEPALELDPGDELPF